MGEESRVGVFVCECGGNISNGVDVEAVCKAAQGWKGVVVARNYSYMCSKPGLDMIQSMVKRHNLNRIVIAACTPRMHQVTFARAMKTLGLNPFLLEVVNLREQCSWSHSGEKEAATKKAVSLVRGGVERARSLEPLEASWLDVEQRFLVVGGGIAGITAALELANQGYPVYLVERDPSIGGHMAQFGKVFPTMDCAQCILTPRMVEVGRNPNIKLMTSTELVSVTGGPGKYHVKLFIKPRGVDPEKCTACGVCSKLCEVEVPNEFNMGLDKRKASYLMFPQSVPLVYTIDFNSCTKCGRCAEVCPRKAIDLEDKGKFVEVDVGAIVVATGYELIDLRKFEEYGYGVHKNVITALHLERLLSPFGPTGGYLRRPNDGGDVKKLAYVLCAGSRDLNRGIPYCSRVCCMYSIKQAQVIIDAFLDAQVTLFYIDIRSFGRGFEEFYKSAQEKGVKFVRGRVSEISESGEGCLLVRAEDTLLGVPVEDEFDLVVLCPALVPSPGTAELAEKLSISLGEDGFLMEKHPKLDPVNSLREAVFVGGCVLGPKDIRDSVSEALGAAAKGSTFVKAGKIELSAEKASVEKETCNGCGNCVNICPFGAITLADGKAVVDRLRCLGCGGCVPECKVSALVLHNSTDRQLFGLMRGILVEKADRPIILAFLDYDIAYNAADLIGLARIKYPANVLIVRVPTTARLGKKHILYAFAMGADGVFLGDAHKGAGPLSGASKITEKRLSEISEALDEGGIDSLRLWFSAVYIPDFRKLANTFSNFVSTIAEMGPIDEGARKKILEEIGPVP